jgi:hypothetical protein
MGGTSLFFTSISVGIILSVSRDIELTKGIRKETPKNSEGEKEKSPSVEVTNKGTD